MRRGLRRRWRPRPAELNWRSQLRFTATFYSYETERKPHVRALTKAAVFFDRVITERRPAVTVLRDPLFRLACRFPGLGSYLRDLRWFPVTAYRSGLLATPPARRGAPRAVGAHIPQPWVLDQHGRRARLDDALGHTAWAVLYTGSAEGRLDLDRWRRAGVQVLQLRTAGSDPGHGTVVDVENQLGDWMRTRGITAGHGRPPGQHRLRGRRGRRAACHTPLVHDAGRALRPDRRRNEEVDQGRHTPEGGRQEHLLLECVLERRDDACPAGGDV